MADRFYGFSSEENLALLNYNNMTQSQMISMGQSGNALGSLEYTPTTNSNYFAANNVDSNNNSMSNYNRNLRYYNQYNATSAFNAKNCFQSKMMNGNINYSQNNIMNNSLLTAPPNYGNVMTTADYQHYMEPSTVGSLSSSGVCHYAYLNGGSSCNNRNRYTPYNHNRVCAAAAAAGQQNSMNNVSSHQQFVPIFYNSNNMSGMSGSGGQFNSGFNPSTAFNPNKHSVIVNSLYENSAMLQNAANTSDILSSIASTAGQMALQSMQTTATVSNNYFKVSNSNLANACSTVATTSSNDHPVSSHAATNPSISPSSNDPSGHVTLQITNLDYSMDEASLRNFLLNQLKPITPVISLVFEGSSYAKVTVPDLYFAKKVVSNLHRKKNGHKRMLVSYTRDSSLTEINTLRCQVAGLLKDVPCYTLPMYKFRELFQSRFKTSISVLDLYKMQDICTINADNNDEKFISLQPDLINSLESSPLIEGLQHSVPYCTIHFKREQHKGWADQDIEPLPNVFMTISEIQQIIYPLLKKHYGEVPVTSLVHCIEGELNIRITPNDNGVNLEHLICCVQGIQIQVNNFGIKILGWLESSKEKEALERNSYSKNSSADPLFQISKEVIELIKMSPKSTMKFSRFIPAYHNHFGKQCRVADYGYTKLIELFEALSSVVQILGDGENRQITLTHRTQIRRFTSDLLRVLRAHGNNSVLLSQLPLIYAQTQNRNFDVTDYGVCDIVDILDGLVNSNVVVLTTVQQGKDILISIPKRKQTISELEKTCVFAGEMVELFRNAVQYTILFQKFVRSYHYHFAYQCRLSDYGFMKLADLMEAIHGVVEMETTNDEDKKINLSPKVALRVFAEQCEELIRVTTGSPKSCMELEEVLKLHKKKYGYQMQPQTLGVKTMKEAVELMPYVESFEKDGTTWIICHNEDLKFRANIYRGMKLITSLSNKSSSKNKTNSIGLSSSPAKSSQKISIAEFLKEINEKYQEHFTEKNVKAMNQNIEIFEENDVTYVRLTDLSLFVLQCVRVVEQRTRLYFNEMKNLLDCGLTTTFKFGFPNLFSLLNAYHDVFSLNFGATQDRCEVSLTAQCELRALNPSNLHTFPSLKVPARGNQKSSRVNRAPLTERLPNQGPPAKTRNIATDANLNNNNNLNTVNNNNIINNNNNYLSSKQNLNQTYQVMSKATNNPGIVRYNNQQPLMNSSFNMKYHNNGNGNGNGNNNNMHSLNSSIYSSSNQSSLLNSSMSNISSGSNKENSFNASMNLLNGSFNNSANGSYNSDHSFSNISGNLSLPMNFAAPAPSLLPPSSTFLMPSIPPTTQIPPVSNIIPSIQQPSSASKLWERRHSFPVHTPASEFFQQAQQLKTMPSQPAISFMSNCFGNFGLPTKSSELSNQTKDNMTSQEQNRTETKPSANNNTNSSKDSGLYEIVNNMKMCPAYEPPKPDTPPSENVPFWIDPIWSNKKESESVKDNMVNIRLPDIKPTNVLPMLLSPYSLSKAENMKQQFNFDSHDRKIA